MESRERLLRQIERKPVDRVPMMESYWDTTVDHWHSQGLPETVTQDNVEEYFHQDLRNITYVDWSFQFEPRVIEETEEYTISVSADNVKTKVMRNSASVLGLSEYSIQERADWEALKDRFVFNESRVNIRECKTRYEETKNTHLQIYMEPCLGFEKFKYCMGTEGLLIAISEDPEWVREMVEATEKLAFDGLDYCMGKGLSYDVGFITEDMGFSNGPFFSPAFYKEIIMPSHKRWCDHLHSLGMKSMLHTCGDNRMLLPLFAEAGFDILNPLEQKAGMDLFQIKRDYGQRFTLWGGIDVMTISSGDENRLHAEIKNKLLAAKQGGGYIFGSDHSIPDNVPLSTYLKMLEWADAYGKY